MEKILRNGKICTISLDGIVTTYEAMGIEAGRIAFLGTNDEAAGLENGSAEIVDLGGRLVLPSFSNSHGHMSVNADEMYTHDVSVIRKSDDESIEAFKERYIEAMKEYAKTIPDKKCIRGGGWSPRTFLLNGSELPTREDLDRVSTEKPVIIQSICGHYYWVNSKALEVANITKDTEAPEHSMIFRDENGDPTGVFQEFAAMELIETGVPDFDFTVDEYKTAIIDILKDKYLPLGITLCFDAMPTENGIKAYEELEKEGKLPMRVRAGYKTSKILDDTQFDTIIADYNAKRGERSLDFDMRTVKFFNDGVGEAVCLEREFPGKPGYYGYTFWDTEKLGKLFEKINRAGMNVQIHCIGDGTVRETVDALEYAENATGRYDLRNNITHLTMTNPREIRRMKELKIMAVPQSYWMSGFLRDVDVYGKEAMEVMYPMKSLFDAGIVSAASDDFPVSGTVDPIEAMQIGMTRKHTMKMIETYGMPYGRDDRKVYGPENDPERECADLVSMIKSHTVDGAYVNFLEEETGTLEIGKSADFVIIDKDLFELDPDMLETASVCETYFKGESVYKK